MIQVVSSGTGRCFHIIASTHAPMTRTIRPRKNAAERRGLRATAAVDRKTHPGGRQAKEISPKMAPKNERTRRAQLPSSFFMEGFRTLQHSRARAPGIVPESVRRQLRANVHSTLKI